MITNATGALVELAEYTPYGSLSRREGSTNVPQKYTGKRLDPTGLYFYEARYYDPLIGRFIQADTIVPAPGDPQALNRYSYVRNNPLKYTDPTGHGWFKKFWRSIVGVAAAAISILAPPLAPAMWALNLGISAATAIQQRNPVGFVGGLVGGALLGGIGRELGTGLTASFGEAARTFFAGALGGAVEFGLGGFGSGFGAAFASGASLSQSLRAGGMGAAAGAAYGAAVQGSYMAGWQQSLHGFTQGAVAQVQGYTPLLGAIGAQVGVMSQETGGKIHPALLLPKDGVWIDRTTDLTVPEAATRLRGGNMWSSNIWAQLSVDAKDSAALATRLPPTFHEPHRLNEPGYYSHYHPTLTVDQNGKPASHMDSHAWYGPPTE